MKKPKPKGKIIDHWDNGLGYTDINYFCVNVYENNVMHCSGGSRTNLAVYNGLTWEPGSANYELSPEIVQEWIRTRDFSYIEYLWIDYLEKKYGTAYLFE